MDQRWLMSSEVFLPLILRLLQLGCSYQLILVSFRSILSFSTVLFQINGSTTVKFFPSSITWNPGWFSRSYLAWIFSKPTRLLGAFTVRRCRLLFTTNLFPAVVKISITNGKVFDN